MNLQVFSVKDLRNFSALLNIIEGAGVTSIIVARERVEAAVQQELLKVRRSTSRDSAIRGRNPRPAELLPIPCPQCGVKAFFKATTNEGETFRECKRCRHSEYIG